MGGGHSKCYNWLIHKQTAEIQLRTFDNTEITERRTPVKKRLRLSYVLTLCLAFILAVAVPLLASAEMIEEWVARYNSPADGDDRADAIAVDASGNVYVTGMSEGDYATVKYNSDGNELWVKRYKGYTGTIAIAVDASGNVYVTGTSGGTLDSAYATVKYDTDGNQLWLLRYNGPADGGDFASAIAVDASGNVYVTGESSGSGTGYGYATVKYGEGLPAGWSMISLPVRPEVPTVANIFPQAVVVYKYQRGAGYVRVTGGENLEVGMGYWILLDNPQPYVMEGTEISEYTIPVENGWYMIGGCSSPAQKMVTSGSIDVIYGYTQGVGYQRLLESQPLERGKGYWILFSNTSEGVAFTGSTSVGQ
jgi:hypothetical protein